MILKTFCKWKTLVTWVGTKSIHHVVKEVYVDKILNKNYIMIPYKYYKYINIRIYMHYLYPYFYVSLVLGKWWSDDRGPLTEISGSPLTVCPSRHTKLRPTFSRLSPALVSPEYGVGARSPTILNHIQWNNTYKFVKSI